MIQLDSYLLLYITRLFIIIYLDNLLVIQCLREEKNLAKLLKYIKIQKRFELPPFEFFLFSFKQTPNCNKLPINNH